MLNNDTGSTIVRREYDTDDEGIPGVLESMRKLRMGICPAVEGLEVYRLESVFSLSSIH
jgi:hypothetical protein